MGSIPSHSSYPPNYIAIQKQLCSKMLARVYSNSQEMEIHLQPIITTKTNCNGAFTVQTNHCICHNRHSEALYQCITFTAGHLTSFLNYKCGVPNYSKLSHNADNGTTLNNVSHANDYTSVHASFTSSYVTSVQTIPVDCFRTTYPSTLEQALLSNTIQVLLLGTSTA